MRFADIRQFFAGRFVSFLFFGALNTGITYLIYLLLSQIIHYQIAYLTAYFTGIVLAYIFNLFFVFNGQSSVKKLLSYPIIYLAQYLLGAGLLYFSLQVIHLPNAVAPILVAIILLPVSYVMNKKILLN